MGVFFEYFGQTPHIHRINMYVGGLAMPYEELSGMQHRLELDGRERLLVSGVEEVERFDEEEIVMNTTAGTLVVGGTNLHIGKLNLDGGELHVDGAIHTLLYEDTVPKGSQGGLFRRLFG